MAQSAWTHLVTLCLLLASLAGAVAPPAVILPPAQPVAQRGAPVPPAARAAPAAPKSMQGPPGLRGPRMPASSAAVASQGAGQLVMDDMTSKTQSAKGLASLPFAEPHNEAFDSEAIRTWHGVTASPIDLWKKSLGVLLLLGFAAVMLGSRRWLTMARNDASTMEMGILNTPKHERAAAASASFWTDQPRFAAAAFASGSIPDASMSRRQRSRSTTRVATLDKADVESGKCAVRDDLRNIAIIAHVDHGKTTITDGLMKQTSDAKDLASMDSDSIEAERGITILAKNAAITYKDVKINLIDTPGHADFGGEVERILNMADACVLLVDAQEGPMPQTKFVLRKALGLKLKTIVCINKVDKPAARPDWVLDTTFDLFAALGADDELCDFPVVYASGINGKASQEGPDELEDTLFPLLDMVLDEVPKPTVNTEMPLQMMVSNLDYDDYVGRICIGRLRSGTVKVGQEIGVQYGEDGTLRKATIKKLWEFKNNSKSEVEELSGGDICAFAGLDDVTIGDTVLDPNDPRPLPPIEVEEPTVSMDFMTNNSPFMGRLAESKFLTGPQIKARLEKEVLTNLALRVEPTDSDSFTVKGRGTLQLGILIENMRREGFEIMIGPPKVLIRTDPETGKRQEPYEEVVVDLPSEYQGIVMSEFSAKGGEMQNMEAGAAEDTLTMSFLIATSNTIGMSSRLMGQTKGEVTMSSRFAHWGDEVAQKDLRASGTIINVGDGKVTAYSIDKMRQKGDFFVSAGDDVYPGMCIGIANKNQDVECNIAKEKAVSNVRASGPKAKQDSVIPPLQFGIDEFLGFMEKDELLEVTPKDIRLLKNKQMWPKKKK